MFTYGGMDMADRGRWPDTEEKRFMVQQEFPWFGKRPLREGIAKKDAEAGRWELDTLTRDMVLRVKEIYHDLYALQQAIRITRQEEEVIRRIVKVAETMYTTGDRAQVDAIKAQTEATMLKQRLLEMLAQEATLKAKLNTLLNRRADTPLGEAVTPPQAVSIEDANSLFTLAVSNRPEVQATQVQVERYEMEKKLMAKESVPDYRLGVEYRDFAHGDDMVMFTVSVDLPLWRSKYRAQVREAEKMRVASQAARQAAERQTALDVQDTSFRLLTAQRTLELYKAELIPQAEARFAASEAGYRTGKTDFMDLLESERFLLDARIMAVMAEGNLGTQSARLERAVGRDLKISSPPAATEGVKHEDGQPGS
jgi:outer membrane protein TolC